MKRAARKIAVLPILLFVVSLVPHPGSAEAQTTAEILPWVNQLRGRQGLSELGADSILEQTAALYAVELAERGVLSHVDERGGRALERFRALGGTPVLVGEILGSGPDLPSLIVAWEASLSHTEVVANPLWTHCGAAAAPAGGTWVWVVLFTSHRVYPLRIIASAEGYRVNGWLGTAAQAEEPILFSGVEVLEPLLWDPRSREFTYLIPLDRRGIFHRLGYRMPDGDWVITNTFFPETAVTSDPGRGSR